MVFKSVKKSMTLMGLVIIMIIAMGVFIGGYKWIAINAESAGVTIDSKYNDTVSNLTLTQSSLEDNVNEIRDNFDNIKEADSTWEVAWNGLKGLGNILLLPISFVTTGIETYTTIDLSLDVIPTWIKTLVLIGITAGIVLLVLSLLKGEPRL